MSRDIVKKRRNALNAKTFPSEMWFHKELKRRACQRFHRNVPIANNRFFGDFVGRKLVIEIDGSSHDNHKQKEYDKTRDIVINAFGFKVVRLRHGDKKACNKFFEEYASELRKIRPKINPNKEAVRQTKKKVDLENRIKTEALQEKRMIMSKENAKRIKHRRVLRNAIENAKQMQKTKANKFLENTLKQLNLTPEEAKKLL